MNIRITLDLNVDQLEEVTKLLRKWSVSSDLTINAPLKKMGESEEQPPEEVVVAQPLQHPGLGESWLKARDMLKILDNRGCSAALEGIEKVVEAMHTIPLTSHLMLHTRNKALGVDYQRIQYSLIGPRDVLQMTYFSIRKVYAKLYINLVSGYRHLVEEMSKCRAMDDELSFALQDAFKEQLQLFWKRLRESGVEASTKLLTSEENEALWIIIITSNTFNLTRRTKNPLRRFKRLESWFKTNNK